MSLTIHQAKSRLLMLAQVCSEEGQQWPRGRQRAELTHTSIQLAYLARSIERQPMPVVESFISSTEKALAAAIGATRSMEGCTVAEVLESFDQGAADHPQLTQVGCMAQDTEHGIRWFCSLPILHAGDHASAGHRWPR